MEKDIKNESTEQCELLAAMFDTTPEEIYEKLNKVSDDSEEPSKDLTEALSSLSSRERDVLTLRYGVNDGRKRTLEEVGNLFGVTAKEIRQVEAKALSKLKNLTKNKKDTILKAEDIVEVSMRIEPQIPEEDEDKIVLYLDDYATDYSVSYFLDKKCFAEASFREEAGCSSFSDIKDYLEQYLKNDIDEIDEYEIFDVEDDGEYQIAKIRVSSIKKQQEK